MSVWSLTLALYRVQGFGALESLSTTKKLGFPPPKPEAKSRDPHSEQDLARFKVQGSFSHRLGILNYAQNPKTPISFN